MPDNGRRGEGSGGNQPQAVAASPAGKRRTGRSVLRWVHPRCRHAAQPSASPTQKGERTGGPQTRVGPAPLQVTSAGLSLPRTTSWKRGHLMSWWRRPGVLARGSLPSGPAAPPSLGMKRVTPSPPPLRVGAGVDGKHRTPRLGQRPSLEGGGVSAGPTGRPCAVPSVAQRWCVCLQVAGKGFPRWVGPGGEGTGALASRVRGSRTLEPRGHRAWPRD